MVVRNGTGRVAKTYSSPVGQKQSVYVANYGTDYTGITIASCVRDDKAGAASASKSAHVPQARTDEDRFVNKVYRRGRCIRDIGFSNEFELFGVLSWKTKKMRWDTKAQDEQVRKYLNKMRRKYPDVCYMAVRHRNKNNTGYHVHILIGGLPRCRMRIKKGKYDDAGRQTYCLLGWSKNGWASVEYIVSQKDVVTYVSKFDRLSKLPNNVRALVTYSKNLDRPTRTKVDLTADEVSALSCEADKFLIYKSSFKVGDKGSNKQKMRYKFCRGKIDVPHTEQKGASNE